MPNRDEYVKPVVIQLHYSTEPEVAIAQTCKTTGSPSGAAVSGCQSVDDPFVPCVQPGS